MRDEEDPDEVDPCLYRVSPEDMRGIMVIVDGPVLQEVHVPLLDEESGAQKARGIALGDTFVAAGHPLTCNGGNPDWSTHHDHEVLMRIEDDRLVCPECGRVQELPARG